MGRGAPQFARVAATAPHSALVNATCPVVVLIASIRALTQYAIMNQQPYCERHASIPRVEAAATRLGFAEALLAFCADCSVGRLLL